MDIESFLERSKGNDTSTEVALQRVQDWLENVYNGDKVPKFEVNQITISILHKIMECNLTADKDAKEMIKSRLYSEEWYTKEAGKINEALSVPGIKMNLFSEPYQQAINSLATSSCALNLKDSSMTSFLLSLNSLSREQSASSRKKTAQLCLSSKLSHKLNSILLKTEHLQRDLKNAEEAAVTQAQQEGKRIRQTEFLQNKQEEYCKTIKGFEDKLMLCKVDDSIYHSTLVKKSEELKTLKEKLNDITAKLGSYQNLSPNENLARLKIEESKEELSKLEKELQMNICSK